MSKDDSSNIKKAVGIRSVFLAARRDKNLVGRFYHMEGQFLLDRDGRHATKRDLADVMVYMAGTYGKELTMQDVELGLLAAAKDISINNEVLEDVTEPESQTEPTAYLDEEPADDAVVSMESSDSNDDFFTEDFKSEAPPPKPQRRGRPGVKPDDTMIAAMLSGDNGLTPNDIGISTFDVAIRYYDWVGNGLAVAESEDTPNHKVKLAVGSTMKAMGWKKRMRKGQWGWHPTEEFSFGATEAPLIDPDDVVLRKRDQLVEDPEQEEELGVIADDLPRLSEKDDVQEIDDDLPWSYLTEGFTDGAEPEPEKKIEFVKIVDVESGTEDVQEMEIVTDKTMTFVMIDDHKTMLEWDAEEGIWMFEIEREAS